MEGLIESIGGVISSIDGWLWSWPLIIVLVGTHLYMTIRTKFIQRKIGTAIKLSLTHDEEAEGNISQPPSSAVARVPCSGCGSLAYWALPPSMPKPLLP